MKVVRKSFHFILRIFFILFLFAAVYAGAAYILPLFDESAEPECKEGICIYVRSNGVHTDFVLPVRTGLFDWRSKLPVRDFEKVDSTYEYIELGWGDKGFYLETPTWDDLKFSTAFRAAFGLSSAAMHVTYRKYEPRTGDLCRKLILSEAQYARLLRYIFSSFRWEGGMPVAIEHPGYSEQDCFYEATGTYSLFQTCNVWTGTGLRITGRRAGLWTPFHRGVIDHCE